jgi:uncharacterized protein
MPLAKIRAMLVIVLLVAGPLFGLEVPALKGRVNDYARILEPEQAAALENNLAAIESSTTAQFVLLTIPSLEGEPLEDFSLRVAEAWKLGQKRADNGLLMMVAVEDRAIRIEVGYGLEGTLPDGKCGTIIRQVIVPEFRNGKYYTGISKAFQVMGQAVAGDPSQIKLLESREAESDHGSGLGTFFVVLILFFLVAKIISPCRKGRWYSSRPGGGWRSFGTGGFSGGGHSLGGFSGGGGSFGGGGASGRW